MGVWFKKSFLGPKSQFEKSNFMSFSEELFEELAFCLTILSQTANFTKQFFNKQLT